MGAPNFSRKGQELIGMYADMARDGYVREDQKKVEVAFADFELRAYREYIRSILVQHAIGSVLDYGCGGSDWQARGFDEATNQSAAEYFGLQNAYRYEPARNLDERRRVDCVISFDVLEHIFIADVPSVLRDIFAWAVRLVVLNIACYPAAARLPNGENAHVTVRDPAWWKGMVDAIAVEFPDTAICLICSTGWRQSNAFPIWSARGWQQSSTFVVAT
jgi:hypothetical protein